MQSKTTRGLRRLLVSTGVISLLLSVAAPSALADKPVETPGKGPVETPGKGPVETPGDGSAGDPGDGKVGSGNGGATGTDRVLICHNGRVIEVDDDGDLSGHAKHGDPVVGSGTVGDECDATVGDGDGPGAPSCDEASVTAVDEHDAELHVDELEAVAAEQAEGDPCDDADPVLVCHDGIVTDADQLPADIDPDALEVAGPDAELGDPCGASTKRVLICHAGRIIEVDDDGDLEGHAAHGDEVAPDQAAAVGTECPVVVVSPETESAPPAGETTTPPPVTPAQPAQPTLPVGTPKPVIVISDDRVAAPAPAAPAAAPAVAPKTETEVLGSVTTRTPSVAGSMVTRTGVSTLAATGTSTTTVLAVLGSVLLLAGLGLQLVARRQTAGSALGA